VVRSTMTGTHKEAFMGIPATGKMQQLGAMPPAG